MWNKLLIVICFVLRIKFFEAFECEVGLNKPTYHTSYETSEAHPSSMSVDGDLNTYSRSYGQNQTSWLRIDLGQEYTITRIVISNINLSLNFESQGLDRCVIEISNRQNLPLDFSELYYGTNNDIVIPHSLTIKIKKSGRYVHVYRNGLYPSKPLIIAEINIYAEFTSFKASDECEVASGKSVSQISTLEDRQAKDAIDGNLNTYSKTDFSRNNINTWLQVDLFQLYLIVKVVVSNLNDDRNDSVYLRYFTIFVRPTNETTDKVGTAFGSTDKTITYYEANTASQSIVFIKSSGEIGRFVTVVKEGPTFTEPLVIGDLAVFAKTDILSTILTTTTTTSKTTSGLVVSPINNATGDNLLPQNTSSLSDLQQKLQHLETEINSMKTDKIVIGIVVGVLAIIIGAILGFLCGYRCQKKSNTIPATYETTKPNDYSLRIRTTRQDYTFLVSFTRTKLNSKSIIGTGPKYWNDLPENIKKKKVPTATLR